MKTNLTLLIITIIFLSSCSTTYYSSIPYDDVYYKGQDQNNNTVADNNGYNEVEVYKGEYDPGYAEEGQDTIYLDENPEYGLDFNSYYNYLYSARLRRFQHPYNSFGYYNNYYTNMYWYESNPYLWGSSIYSSLSWMYPYDNFGWYGNFHMGLSWGFGGYGMGWPSYYGWPYYGMGYYGYNYYGYGNGYYNPYYYTNGYYYNSQDSYSEYYRHRPSNGRNYDHATRAQSTFGEKYEQKYATVRADRNSNNAQRPNSRDSKTFTNKSLTTGTPSTGRNRSNTTIANGSAGGNLNLPYSRLNNADRSTIQEKTTNQTQKSYTKPQVDRNSSTINSQRINNQNTNTVKTYQKPVLKYSKPNTFNSPNNRNTNTRQYSTPQKSVNSGTNIGTPSNARQSTNTVGNSIRRIITAPTRSSKNYFSPTQSNGRPISISRPSSSGGRSFSPSRGSSGSYSAPTGSGSRSVSSGSSSGSSVQSSSSGSSTSSGSSSGGGARGTRK